MTIPFSGTLQTDDQLPVEALLGEAMLDRLMPMHLILSDTGHIVRAGPTLQKLQQDAPILGRRFLEVFEMRRPRDVTNLSDIAAAERGRLKLVMREGARTSFTGLVAPLEGSQSLLVNLSFGIGVVDAVRTYDLTGSDFASTDLALEMLYLFEAKSAALAESAKLNKQLKGAKSLAEEKALTDGLTGLRNRRAMDMALTQLTNRADSFAVMRIDLDFFKEVNDTLGHEAGDIALIHVAKVLRRETRSSDHVARVGGDEFVILIRNLVDPLRLTGAASRIISALEEPIPFQDTKCNISASIGITMSHLYLNPSPEQMLRDADTALYESKRNGRAQATVFRPGAMDMED